MDIKEIEKVVRKIQGRLFKKANSYSIGALKSHFRGSGLQFKEHRIYCHGDDIRFIDWKLYAKSNTPYVKTFEEERNVEIVIFLDMSLSMLIGYKGVTKIQAAINIAYLLALLSKQTNDSVQFILWANEEIILPKSSGKLAIIYLINELRKIKIMNDDGKVDISYRPDKKVSIANKMKSINRFIKKKREVVILSDFEDFQKNKDLEILERNRRAHCFRIVSPLDKKKRLDFFVYGFNSSRFPSMESRVLSVGKNKRHLFS